jgi:hypothetical protein
MPVEDCALPSDWEVRRLQRCASGWSGGFNARAVNGFDAWRRSQQSSAANTFGTGVGQFSCRRFQVVARDNLKASRALTGQLV